MENKVLGKEEGERRGKKQSYKTWKRPDLTLANRIISGRNDRKKGGKSHQGTSRNAGDYECGGCKILGNRIAEKGVRLRYCRQLSRELGKGRRNEIKINE